MKGEAAADELAQSKRALFVLKGEAMPLATIALPGVEQTHSLITVRKTAPTPRPYPRKAGTPTKDPIGVTES